MEQVQTSKTSFDILFHNSDLKGCMECREEVLLSDVGYVSPHLILDLPTICLLKRAKTANIKRLEDVR